MASLEERVKAALNSIQRRDRELGEELRDKLERAETRETAGRMAPRIEEALEGREAVERQVVLETIVLRTGRPVLSVQRDKVRLEFRDAESEVWRERLRAAEPRLLPAIRAVGRIELQHNPRFEWVGTGWLVRPEIVVTNRHVAAEFGRASGGGFVFRIGRRGRRMAAAIDFLEEFERTASRTFQLKEILHIEDEDGPDLAFLRVAPDGGSLAPPVALASRAPEPDQQVAVIGYPARDSRLPDQRLMESIFGNVFDKKRLAPGQIMESQRAILEHDCSTLGGNSGSVVLDLRSGEALGVHFAGRFLDANFAVPARVVAERLERIGRKLPRPEDSTDNGPVDSGPVSAGRSITVTVPIRITVDVGEPAPAGPQPAQPPSEVEEDEEIDETEAAPEDYADRPGYAPDFLGDGIAVALPEVTRNAGKVLTFELDGKTQHELRYRHFSVVMRRDRRLCFFSAVNIDGKQPHKIKRPAWRFDPRIPRESQILKECYGEAPKFSRGHMTRREDPIWGTKEDAAQGNADSMHATNAVPQMQPFNGGIWLGLEDYALEHARQDDMRISVFTGPFLFRNDPKQFGVKIPRSFWKVIAFIHDETGELCATGYTMSQASFLRQPEFVFGQYDTFQTPIARIEEDAGLSFGELAAADPLAGVEEALPRPLADFRQIRFLAR